MINAASAMPPVRNFSAGKGDCDADYAKNAVLFDLLGITQRKEDIPSNRRGVYFL